MINIVIIITIINVDNIHDKQNALGDIDNENDEEDIDTNSNENHNNDNNRTYIDADDNMTHGRFFFLI